MAPGGKESPPLWLPFTRKEMELSPRAFDPPSSHRISVASTGVGDVHTSLFHSPESTYRSFAPLTPKAGVPLQDTLQPHPPPESSSRIGPQEQAPRRVRLINEGPSLEGQKGTLVSPDLIHAKKHGKPLPPLKEVSTSMIHEDITPQSARLISMIPKRLLLGQTGVSIHTHDPMFTEDIVQYELEHPIPPGVLHKFPNYEKFPLLLSRVERSKLAPNITDLSNVHHLRGHNEAMLENHWPARQLSKEVSEREAYMYVPNFGRVQVLLIDYPDGSSYPLVTLPKMTPYDILRVLDKMQVRQRSWIERFIEFIHRASCRVL